MIITFLISWPRHRRPLECLMSEIKVSRPRENFGSGTETHKAWGTRESSSFILDREERSFSLSPPPLFSELWKNLRAGSLARTYRRSCASVPAIHIIAIRRARVRARARSNTRTAYLCNFIINRQVKHRGSPREGAWNSNRRMFASYSLSPWLLIASQLHCSAAKTNILIECTGLLYFPS